ncbi:MAG: hypothetical protein ACKVOW_15600 [Chitinophagaceae bacterium]
MLKKKIILIISPQEWGNMLLSKHHYALELAKKGNRVYFLNPPDQLQRLKPNSIHINSSPFHNELFFIEHRLFFPFGFKFKSMRLFHFLMRFHIKKLLKQIGQPFDIVWSFDIGNIYPLSFFSKKSIKIFHPVDEPLTQQAINAAADCDIIFSVTNEILTKYQQFPAPKYFINHGVSEDFLAVFKEKSYQPRLPVKVGYSGNMLRNDIDRRVLLNIISENKQIEFHIFGSYQINQSNIGGDETDEIKEFIQQLIQSSNVLLHGVLDQQKLAKAFAEMDAFLICYDIEKDQSKGTNYHKIMEYLATGRIIISNNITTYAHAPSLIQMAAERDHNKQLLFLFNAVIENLRYFNSTELLEERKKFAGENVYSRQLERIEELLKPYFMQLVTD